VGPTSAIASTIDRNEPETVSRPVVIENASPASASARSSAISTGLLHAPALDSATATATAAIPAAASAHSNIGRRAVPTCAVSTPMQGS
jgi:hypothetical protein